MPQAEYESLGKGIKALRLWESIGPQWPQIAILQLSSEEYKKLLKSPKNYINGLNIFGKTPTKKVRRCCVARLMAKKTETSYGVVINHDSDCTSMVISSSGLVA